LDEPKQSRPNQLFAGPEDADCEQCENFTTSVDFVPSLKSQLADVTALRQDAEARGWDTEIARHNRVINSLTGHLNRLAQSDQPRTAT